MSAVQHQQLYDLWKRARIIKGKKTSESSRTLKARVAMLEAKSENRSDESSFADTKPTTCDRNNPDLDRKCNRPRQCHADA